MALTKNTVAKAIQAVSTDPVASGRIKSILAPILGRHSGFVRNIPLTLAHTLNSTGAMGLPSLWMRKEFDPLVPGSTSARLNCDGIANAAEEALTRQKIKFPEVRLFGVKGRSAGFTHAGLWLMMRDKTHYILDWWMTLDIEDPVVFRLDDWDKDRKGKGILYSHFAHFS